MSEEVAASIGDVLAENERLKQQLAQAERNAEEWKSIALTTRLTAEAWEQAAVRLERKTEKTAAVNRETQREHLACTGARPGPEGCAYTEPLPEAIRLRRQGQAELFDFGEE